MSDTERYDIYLVCRMSRMACPLIEGIRTRTRERAKTMRCTMVQLTVEATVTLAWVTGIEAIN